MTEQMWRSKFGARLANMINARGSTRKEFAEDCGLSEKTLERYIYGRRSPSSPNLVNIARVLRCSTDELVDFGEKIVK